MKNDILENSPAVQLLDLIEMILAAGYILAKEYGEDAAGTDKDGIERIQRAENMLKELLTGKITLIDNTGGAFDTSQGQEATIK